MTRDRRNKKLNIATGKAKLVNNNDWLSFSIS